MIEHILSAEEFREIPFPWFGYEENTRLRELREALAAFLHAKRDELAIVRNATEANNVVCNGLDLRPGDQAPAHRPGTSRRALLLGAEGHALRHRTQLRRAAKASDVARTDC